MDERDGMRSHNRFQGRPQTVERAGFGAAHSARARRPLCSSAAMAHVFQCTRAVLHCAPAEPRGSRPQ
eukprot:3141399-Pleurochrysis_carterae.AAC.1